MDTYRIYGRRISDGKTLLLKAGEHLTFDTAVTHARINFARGEFNTAWVTDHKAGIVVFTKNSAGER